jgi:cation-transporting ATPase E
MAATEPLPTPHGPPLAEPEQADPTAGVAPPEGGTVPADSLEGLDGLDAAAVAQRVAAGQVNEVPNPTSRSVAQIVRANVLTRFNFILGGLLAVILVVGPLQDALFGVVLVANTAIGIVQELRAKRSLDRLALLNAPHARVVRAGAVTDVAAAKVVLDDVLELAAGDQVVVDAVVLSSAGLELDESLLTGEAEAVDKAPGDGVLSGSFVAAGWGRVRATRVGPASYAAALAGEAKRFSLVRSELKTGIDQILLIVTWAIIPAAVLLVSGQLTTHNDVAEALRGSVAGIGAMVPEGLVLLTSVAFAVGAVRLARQSVLVQELAALEGLARVDIVCVDKTGTLTEPDLEATGTVNLEPDTPVAPALGAVAALDPAPNRTLAAIAKAFPAPTHGWTAEATVPFSSARKWSGATFAGQGSWVLGAPDLLIDAERHGPALLTVQQLAEQGHRVVLLGRTATLTDERTPVVDPVALVVLQEVARPDAAQTVEFFAAQGVTVKVISGDHPMTVAAVAARAGIDVGVAVDGRTLPEDPDALGAAVEESNVFGRVTPQQKQAMVGALQARGHTVAMTGDGVNDVLALKDADLGIAMGSGSAATRAVARIVLLDDSFAALPSVVAEGRRVIGNVERVANLFVTKTVYAFLLAIAVGVAQLPFPFLPRHLSIISSLTIGVPAFFLALAPNSSAIRPGFTGRVIRFAAPAGIVAAAASFGGYALARHQPGVSLAEARTVATIVLFCVTVWILGILARPLTPGRRGLLAAMVLAFTLAFLISPIRRFFALDTPDVVVVFAAIGVASIADLALEAGWRLAEWARVAGERRRAEAAATASAAAAAAPGASPP